MDIISLEDQYEELYCKCLEDWSKEMQEAGDYKKTWLVKKKDEGLRVKLAKEEDGRIVGMIQYVPIEKAPIQGKNLYYIYCIWVHGYKQGVGNFQGKGIGKKLLEAAETDAKSLCAQGIVAWGIRLPFFMRSKWFKKHGYTSIDKDGMLELVWKPFSEDAVAPKLSKLKKKPTKRAGVVTITCLRNGWCPAQNLTVERIKRLVQEYPGSINYVEIDTEKRENLDDWGVSDQVFIDDKSLNVGPPPSYAKLKKLITKKVKALPKVS